MNAHLFTERNEKRTSDSDRQREKWESEYTRELETHVKWGTKKGHTMSGKHTLESIEVRSVNSQMRCIKIKHRPTKACKRVCAMSLASINRSLRHTAPAQSIRFVIFCIHKISKHVIENAFYLQILQRIRSDGLYVAVYVHGKRELIVTFLPACLVLLTNMNKLQFFFSLISLFGMRNMTPSPPAHLTYRQFDRFYVFSEKFRCRPNQLN